MKGKMDNIDLKDLPKKCRRLNKLLKLNIDVNFIKECVFIAKDIEKYPDNTTSHG